MSLPHVFNFGNIPVRTILIDSEPWWIAKDVCDVLGLSNARSSVALLDDDEKGVHTVDTPSGDQDMTIINEPGLYSLIIRSRKAEAKAFKRWITHEVLPSIRKTGAYALSKLSRVDLLKMALESEEKTLALEQRVKASAPAVRFARDVERTENHIDLTYFAKMVNIPGLGPNQIYPHLLKIGILYKRGRKWAPKQKYINGGYLHIRQDVIETTDGHKVTSQVITITGKGQYWLYQRLTGLTLAQQVIAEDAA